MHSHLENKLFQERFDRIIPSIMSRLISIEEIEKGDYDFSNGHGYVQHNKDVVNSVTYDLIEFAYDEGYCGDEKFLSRVKEFVEQDKFRQNSIIGRYLDGTPFYKHWYRLMCIDSLGREYGQPFFAINPDEIEKDECLNKHLRTETIDKLLDE